jgi:pimeloyl-ACP methyl ester carboxylesterase
MELGFTFSIQIGGKSMIRKFGLIFLFACIFFTQVGVVLAQDVPQGCDVIYPDGSGTGEVYLICIPEEWNGGLLVYAHGYVAFNQPVGLPWDQLILPDGTSIPEVITNTGFAFATTSYSTNGLAIKEGVTEVVGLVNYFDGDQYPIPNLVLLAGPSEGGLITALAIERYPEVFDGGLSTCGPIGDFKKQIDYWGDFRVAFDYFYPGLLRPTPVEIPTKVIDNWDSKYAPRILDKIQRKPENISQLLNVTGAPFDSAIPATTLQTVERILWYNVFATNDGVQKLGGQPFDNQEHIFIGSFNDGKLNKKAKRFSADQLALDEIKAYYETTGDFSVPLVTMHTTGDEVVPYWHVLDYGQKISNPSLYAHIPINRYGHCNFRIEEVLFGFGTLYFKVLGQPLVGIEEALPNQEFVNAYLEIQGLYGVSP